MYPYSLIWKWYIFSDDENYDDDEYDNEAADEH